MTASVSKMVVATGEGYTTIRDSTMPLPFEFERMLFMPKKFDPEVKDRAVRMVLDRVEEAGSVTKAVALVSPKVDVGRETLRRWVCQHRVDAGLKDGPTSDDLAELKRLRGEVKRLREDNEILRKASIFFAGELDPRNR